LDSVRGSLVRGTGSPHRVRDQWVREIRSSSREIWAGRSGHGSNVAKAHESPVMDGEHVVQSRSGSAAGSGGPRMSARPVSRSLEDDEGKIVEFFGQLWSVPRTTVPGLAKFAPISFGSTGIGGSQGTLI
jgi:hypothetical protein